MLHFVIKQLRQQRADFGLLQLDSEICSLIPATRVSLDQVRAELTQLKADHAFIRSELCDHRSAYEDPKLVSTPPSPPTPPSPELAPNDPPEQAASQETAEETSKPAAVEEVVASPEEPAPNLPEPTARPPVNRKRNLLQAILANGIDLASVAESWVRGTAGTGQLGQFSHAEVTGFGLLDSGSEGPPPGWLFLWRPSQRWQRCWCEIRSSVLVLYRIKGKGCQGASYVVLSNAVIVPFGTLQSSEVARRLCADTPYGFELWSSDGGEVVRLCSSHQHEANSWLKACNELARKPGAGMLQVLQDGHPIGQGKLRCFCHAWQGQLLAFATPRDGIEGKVPKHRWNLEGVSVRALRDSLASDAARQLLLKRPFGF